MSTPHPPLPPTGRARPWLLAIDSSTERAGIALTDGIRLAEVTWTAGRTQTTALLSEIDRLCGLEGVALAGIGAVAVATGPGAFSGLRVGFGIAKGLYLALGVPLLGVPTLDATAAPWSHLGGPVIAVVRAGRGRIVWAEYADRDGAWNHTAPPSNGTPAELADRCRDLAGAVWVVGEADEPLVSELRSIGTAVVPELALRLRRPGAVAQLAWPRFVAGEADDPVALAPVYVHGR